MQMSLTRTLQSGGDGFQLCNKETKRHKSGPDSSRQKNANSIILQSGEAEGVVNLDAENTGTNNVIDLTTPVPSPSVEKDVRAGNSHSAISKASKEETKVDRRIWDVSPPINGAKTTSYQDFFGCTYRTAS